MMQDPQASPPRDELSHKSLRRALSHLMLWHRIGSVIAVAVSFIPAFALVDGLGRIEAVRNAAMGAARALPFVESARRVEVVLFLAGGLALLGLASIGTGIASDIVRERIVTRTNAQPDPVRLAEGMKRSMTARAGRIAAQYRFFPKHAVDGKLRSNAVYVEIGVTGPFVVLLAFFFWYFRW